MISILSTEACFFRALGWVQDPSNLRSLCNVVAIFDETSIVHQTLRNEILPNLVEERDGRELMLSMMNTRPLKLTYPILVGTSFNPRSSSRCNGIVQAAVKGQQGREFIGDWPADNFVRWAHAFGFLQYSYGEDSFQITETGRRLVAARSPETEYPGDPKNEDLSKEETQELTLAILAYPPAVRMLNLLAEHEEVHLTKFEIGRQLGFIGEGGFTSLPQKLMLRALVSSDNNEERRKMRMDWDGSSDKYARMIGKWLVKLELAEQEAKYFDVPVGDEIHRELIGQAFRITAKGYMAVSKSQGKSRHKKIAKNVCFEMLASKGTDREYLRTRRAYLLKYLNDNERVVSVNELSEYLKSLGVTSNETTIVDDLRGLTSIGIQVSEVSGGFRLDDRINDFMIPVSVTITPTDLEEEKEELRSELKNLSHEYLSLMDLAYDSKQNRLFEMKVMQLLTEECGLLGSHLGGARKPDGILYYEGTDSSYGIILDTKAYSNGYNLPITQADEMARYISENQDRNEAVNPNCWWDQFPSGIKKYYYLFVSGHFKGNYQAQLERISLLTGVHGRAVSVVDLLRMAESIKNGAVSLEKLEKFFFET